MCRDAADVLVLPFEDLAKDLRSHLPAIAAFIGIEAPSEELLDKVAWMSSKEAMLRHESKMDESWTHAEAARLGRSPRAGIWAPAARVTVGGGMLSDASRTLLLEQWASGVTYAFPELKEYQDIVDCCRDSLLQKFPVLYAFKP